MQPFRSLSQHSYILDWLTLGKLSVLITSLGAHVCRAATLHCPSAIARVAMVRHGVALCPARAWRRNSGSAGPECGVGAGVPSFRSGTRAVSTQRMACSRAHTQARIVGTKIAVIGRLPATLIVFIASIVAYAAKGSCANRR